MKSRCRIGFDARMIRNTGIGTYIRELLGAYRHLENARSLGVTLFGNREAIKECSSFTSKPFYSKIYSISEQLEYPFRLQNCELWHAPHYNIPVFKGRTKLVVTVHDLIHWIFRKDFFNPLQGFYAERMMRHAVESADHIIAVSKKTSDDLIDHFDADPERITVIHESVSDRFCEVDDRAVQEVRQKYSLPPEFFLYVGSLKPHKNLLPLIRLFKENRDFRSSLVLVGKKDGRYPSGFEELAQIKTEGKIIHLENISSEDLIKIYNAALGLVHPSLYEGFGLTLLEAMACGCPVIAARAASLPEIAGDGAFLIDPYSPRELADALLRFESAPTLRDDLRRKGKRQLQRFSWAQTAYQTSKVYERVLGD